MSMKASKTNAAKRRKKIDINPYLLLAPALIVMICIVFVPVAKALISSFQSYDLRYPNRTAWIGLQNYVDILTANKNFWPSFRRTIVWVFCGVGFQFFFGFLLALLLNQKFKLRGLFRSLLMIPWVTSGVLIGLIWRWMYDGELGVINDILVKIGVLDRGIAYLSSTELAMPMTIITLVWQGIPFFALMILAALQGVSSEMLEAADIDGANRLQKLLRVTVPSIKNTLFVTLLLRIIWVVNSVDIILNLTSGGPAKATTTIAVLTYQEGKVLNLGYASAIAIIMTILMLFVAIPYLRSTFKQN